MRSSILSTILIGVALVPWVSGCGSDDESSPSSPGSPSPARSPAEHGRAGRVRTAAAALPSPAAELPDPRETVELWRRWRAEKQYRLLQPYIDPEQRTTFIDTLLAVDLFLIANEEIRLAIAEVLGDHRTGSWDLSALGENLGLFSKQVTLISVQRDAGQAVITFQVGQRLPLEVVHLTVGPTGWMYQPGSGPAELPAAVRDLAQTLSDIAKAIRRDKMSERRINQEFRLRIWPRLVGLEKVGVQLPPEP